MEDSSGSKANVAIINNLVASGFDVIVYHYTLKNIQLKGPTCYAIPEIKYSPFYFLSRMQRLLARNFNIDISSFLQGIFGFSFTFFNDCNSILKALKKLDSQPDLVLTLSKGASFRPHYALLKLPNWHEKWVAYVHDPYPFHFYPKPFNYIESSYKFKEAFFKKMTQKAKFSAFPSQLLLEWMGNYFPEFLKTGVLIPHQITNYELEYIPLPSYFNPSKFNLLHAGNLLKERSPKGLLDGFVLFLQQNPEARKEAVLHVIGPASSHESLLKKYEIEFPEINILNKSVPFNEVYLIQKTTMVNIILESKSEISPFLPAKFPHCVEANKTILLLAPCYSETRRLLGNDYLYWSEVHNVEKIARLIGTLYKKWQLNPNNLVLNQPHLSDYLSASFLKKTIDGLVLREV